MDGGGTIAHGSACEYVKYIFQITMFLLELVLGRVENVNITVINAEKTAY